jgi:hypothetical protein
MPTRSLLRLLPLLTMLLVAFACGHGNDPGSVTPTPQATPTASSSGPTAQVAVTPSRSRPPSADHVGLGLIDIITFLREKIGTATPGVTSCPYDAINGIIDCSSQGSGRIALDPVPHGADQWDCRALLTPSGEAFAASCTAAASPKNPVVFIYEIVQ